MISYNFGIFASSINKLSGPGAGFIHWRILVDDKNDPSFGQFVNLGEVNFRTTVGVDSVMNGVLSASTTYDTGYEADKAVDGVNNTYWACAANQWSGAWWRMSTTTPRDVKELTLKAPGNSSAIANQMPQSFRLQASEDGVVWVTKMTVVGETGWAQNEVRSWKVTNTIDAYIPLTVAAHRYWSINVLDADQRGNVLPGLSEIEFRATVGGADMTSPGGPLTLSRTPSSGTVADMIDGNTSTRCQWSGYPTRVAYDFTTPVVVGEIAIAPNSDAVNRSPADYTLDWSDDGVTWTPVARAILPPGTYTTVGTFVNVDFTPPISADARYWAISDITSAAATAMAEIELRASRGGTDITAPTNVIYSNDIYGSSYDAKYAFDNDLNTFWAANQTSGSYITIDLGSGVSSDVRELKLTNRDGLPSQAMLTGALKFSKADRAAYWSRGIFSVPAFEGPQNGKTVQLEGPLLPAGWNTAYLPPAPMTTDLGSAGIQNNRRAFNKTLFNSHTKQIRLTLKAVNAADTDIVDIRVGYRGVSNVDFESDPVIVTVGGKSVFTIPMGTEVITDPINLPVDGTKDIVVAYRTSYNAAKARLMGATTSSANIYIRTFIKGGNPAVTESGQLSDSGYTANNNISLITKVEWNVADYVPPVEAGHRYWRAKALVTPSGRTRAAEVGLLNVVGGATLTTGGTAIGPTGQNPKAAFDADPATFWRSTANSNPRFTDISIAYNFGQKVEINAMSMLSTTSGSGEMMTEGFIQYSDDGYNTWTDSFYFRFDGWVDAETKTADRTSVYNPRIQKIAKHVLVKQTAPVLTKIAKHVIVKAL